MKKFLQRWLGIQEIQNTLDDNTWTDFTYKQREAVNRLIREEIKKFFTTHSHDSLVLADSIVAATESEMWEISKEAASHYVRSEEFIDSIIQRIQRKQLS